MKDELRKAKETARIMDSKFEIGGIRFGIDAIAGFLPGVGDFITVPVSMYVVWIGMKMGVPYHVFLQMLLNIAIDSSIGSVSVVGDVFDVFFKANDKNIKLIESCVQNKTIGTRLYTKRHLLALVGLSVLLIVISTVLVLTLVGSLFR